MKTLKIPTVFLLVALAFGCSKNKFEPLTNYMKQQDELGAGYFHGSADQARDSISRMLEYYQDPNTKLLTDTARAQMVYQTYCRLYMLESRTGHDAAAQDGLDKAQRWQQQFYKLANAQGGAPELTPDKIRDLVDEIDRRENNGQLPDYTQTKQP
jgi:hypothetical protein